MTFRSSLLLRLLCVGVAYLLIAIERVPKVVTALSPRSLWHRGFDQLYIEGPVLDIRRTVDGRVLVTMEPAARDAILEVCKGEPFLFQLAGERAWYAGSTDVITPEQVYLGWERARLAMRGLSYKPHQRSEISAAARELQVSRTTMWRLMKKHAIET